MGQELYKRLEEITGSFSKTRKEMMSKVEDTKYPLTSEPALIHPLNSSVVKIRENGTIDIFVGTDNGLRIDPVNKSISSLSNSQFVRSTYAKQKVSRDLEQEVGGKWKIDVLGDVEISSSGTLKLEGKQDVTINGRTMREWADTKQSI